MGSKISALASALVLLFTSRPPQCSFASFRYPGRPPRATAGTWPLQLQLQGLAGHRWHGKCCQRKVRTPSPAWSEFGPVPARPPPTAEDIYAAEFSRDFHSSSDQRYARHSEDILQAAEAGDWEHASRLLEDMWNQGLDPDSWLYGSVVKTCMTANLTESIEIAMKLHNETKSWSEFPSVERFQLFPVQKWQRQMKMVGSSIHNTLDWNGRDPVPSSEYPCWLLPAQDDAAEHVAARQAELRHAGWKVLACDAGLAAELRSKDALPAVAARAGILADLPAHYCSPSSAVYPCMLKAARETWGKNIHIVESSEEALRLMYPGKLYSVERRVEQELEYTRNYLEQHGQERDEEDALIEYEEKVSAAVQEWLESAVQEEVGKDWVLQELVMGKYEYSTSLLMLNGEIMDYACSRYEYSSEAYVWPQLEYLRAEYVSVPESHLAVMQKLLANFSGICNVNYKLRPDGRLCIFEVNPRVGGDLVFDVPKPRVRAFMEKLDAMFS